MHLLFQVGKIEPDPTILRGGNLLGRVATLIINTTCAEKVIKIKLVRLNTKYAFNAYACC